MATTNTSTGKNVYQIITDRICEQLEKGIIPWDKPWTGTQEGAISYTTRKPYSLLNQFLLDTSKGQFITFNEIKKLNGSIKKGAKSKMVVFFKRYVKEIETTNAETGETEKKEKISFCLQYYNVFNVDDCTGIPVKPIDDTTPIEFTEDLTSEQVINNYVLREQANGFSIEHKASNEAYYSPVLDKVVLPLKEQFKSVAEYYSTAFHEIAHSTLKECRCNRKQTDIAFFGNDEYSKEELVAEITATNLCNITGVETNKSFRNSAAYIQSWLRALKNDVKLIVFASSQAEKATKYILNIAE